MDEKITMKQKQWEGHVNKDVLPSRFEFIKKAAEEGRLMKVEQRTGNEIVECSECGRDYVKVGKTVEPGGAEKVVIGGKFSITFFVDTKGEEVEIGVKADEEPEKK